MPSYWPEPLFERTVIRADASTRGCDGRKDSDPTGGRERDEPGADGQTGQQETSGEPEPAETGTAERPGGQADLLGELAVLRRQARSARHAYWLPLLLFGVLSCADDPVLPRRFTRDWRHIGRCRGGADLGADAAGSRRRIRLQRRFFLGYYWLVALVGGYCALMWYRFMRAGSAAYPGARLRGHRVLLIARAVLPPLSLFGPLWQSWLS